jgi:hypothetical protein
MLPAMNKNLLHSAVSDEGNVGKSSENNAVWQY